MRRAVSLAALGPVPGPNPRVGCVLTDAHGRVIGEGYHRGAGTAHAEVAALEDAHGRGEDARGAVAYVTLEPCAHAGRTGPCAVALIEAGVARVCYAVADPGLASGGGAAQLAEAGVEVELHQLDDATALNRRWVHAVSKGRPYVIAKWAATLDGRTAAADGTSVWITGEQARDHTHQERAVIDALLVGTGTVISDDPQLSARPQGVTAPHQPLRVVMGHRATPAAAVWRDANAVHCDTHDPHEVMATLTAREVRTVMVEGGATVMSAFVRAGLVDEIHAYIAPVLLGAGPSVIQDVGIDTMSHALRSDSVTVTPLGVDTLVTALLTEGT
ncbi:MAG: bifunctional diaminohydroxyphosphoribosylaminopyrimidine deaminase/5-amino-6-(5-phosphoribosylamino)uracil reductase RibD [Demequina sp.]